MSLVEFRTFSRTQSITPPVWTAALGARHLGPGELLAPYQSGYTMRVPLMDANIYLPYLRGRAGAITSGVTFARLEDVARDFDTIINCTGFDARALVDDETFTTTDTAAPASRSPGAVRTESRSS